MRSSRGDAEVIRSRRGAAGPDRVVALGAGGVAPLARVAGCALAVALVGCGSDPVAPVVDLGARADLAAPPLCTEAPDGGPPATLASVERLVGGTCALPGCHDGHPVAAPGGTLTMDFRSGHFRAEVVDVMAHEACGGRRVVPGQPEASYLLHKVSDDAPCAGSRMPLSEVGPAPLRPCEIDLLRRWIAAGAPP